jgi:Holliday junction resolvasome RuvABC endonuclease subunit
MNILCLDLSLASAGVAIINDGYLIYTNAFETNNKLELPQRILQFINYLDDVIKQYKPDEVLIERFLFGAGARTTIKTIVGLACLNTAVQLHLLQKKINYKLIAVATVRAKLRKITGMKKVVKEDVEGIVEQYFILPEKKKGKSDIADALALYLTFPT